MQDYFEQNFESVVETDTYLRLRDAVLAKVSPVFLSGSGGSGKTTSLGLLAHEWQSTGTPVLWVSLREVYREADLVSMLRAKLTDVATISRVEESQVIASSGGRALRSIVEIIGSLETAPLILLDGLDETRDSQLILRFVRLVSENTDALVVVAGRRAEGDDSQIFKTVIKTQPFTEKEIQRLIERSNLRAKLSTAQRTQLSEIAQGSPLLAKVLVEQIERGQDITGDAFGPHNLKIHFKRLIESAIPKKDFKSSLQLLVLIALRGRMSPSEIVSLGFDIPQALITSGLLHNSGTIILVHTALEALIFSLAGIVPDEGTKLQDLKFGAEEAERDELLYDSFIEIAGYTELLLGTKNIVIGDRGTGKSAMFSRLQIDSASASENRAPQIIRLTHPAEMLKKLETNGSELRTAEQFRAGWLTLAAYSLATSLGTFSSSRQKRVAAHLREALCETDEPQSTFNWILKGLWRWRSSIKIKLGPILIEPVTLPNKGHRGGDIVDLSAFIRDAAQTLKKTNQSVIIALDRIDEIHKYDRTIQEKAVQGLFLAEGDLAQISGVNFLIFLRSDLFKIYDIQEKNKLVSRSLNIIWAKQDLLQFLVDRVVGNECLAGLRRFIKEAPNVGKNIAINAIMPSQIEDAPAIDWLWDSMENGNGHISPRQLILLLILAVQSPAAQGRRLEGFPIFSASALQWAMDQLSELSFKELVDDFRVAPTFLSNCRAGKIEAFDLASVAGLFNQEDGPTSLQVDLLERLGFLERVVVQHSEGKKSTEFRVPKLFTRCWAVS